MDSDGKKAVKESHKTLTVAQTALVKDPVRTAL
jgi:hypothetical protein